MSDSELELLQEAFASIWIVLLGPHVDAIERDLAEAAKVSNAVALHLGLTLTVVEAHSYHEHAERGVAF